MTKSIWTSLHSKVPEDMFSFAIRHLSNSLPTCNSLKKWNFAQSADCSFSHLPETLLYVVAGCKSYLKEYRYTWRHNSVLLVLANFFRAHSGSSLYVDLSCFYSPSIKTGDTLHPDLILVTADKQIHILQLAVRSESGAQESRISVYCTKS